MEEERKFLPQIFYFSNLFYRESLESEIDSYIQNADLTLKFIFFLILGFKTFDLLLNSEVYRFLQIIKLKSYLGFKINLEELYTLRVPVEHFNLLLEVVNLLKISDNVKILRMIVINIPKDFTWEGIDEDFKKKVLHIFEIDFLLSGSNFLRFFKSDNLLEGKVSLADLYYRPGELGYYKAVSD